MVALGLLVCGCGRTLPAEIVRSVLSGRNVVHPVPSEIAASPYASLMLDDGFLQGVMVLGNDDEGRLSWHAGSHVLFLCEGDQVCGTQDMAVRLDNMRFEGANPFTDLRAIGDGPVEVTRHYDWRDGYRYGIPVTGTIRRVGEELVEILERPRNLVRYEESLRGPGVTGTNTYWIDASTGQLWKSRQLVAPGIYADIVMLKPYHRRTP